MKFRAGVWKWPSLFPLLGDLSLFFVRTNLAMKAVPWERHWSGARGHNLGFMGLLVKEQFALEMSPGNKPASWPLSVFRSPILKVKRILTKQVAAAVWHLPMNDEVVDWKTTQNHGAANADAHRVWVERHCHCEEADDGKRDRNKQGNLGKRTHETIRENWWL